MPPIIPPKKTSVFKEQAKVLFSYTAENDDELTIKEGDIINILEKEIEDKGWMKGELKGKVGVFPDNFVEIIKSSPFSNQLNNSFKNSNNYVNNNGSTDNVQPKLPIKKSVQESNKLTKVISNKFNEIISKSNGNLNESTPQQSKNSLFLKQNTDDLNKSATDSQIAPSLPLLPLKKSKLFSSPKPFGNHKVQESSDNEQQQQIPQATESDLTSFIDEQQNSLIKPLQHLTASRVKGPNNRRPPSIIQVQLPKDDELNLKSSTSLNNINDLTIDKKETNLNHTSNDNLDDKNLNKELPKQNSNNNLNEMPSSKVTTPTTLTTNQPLWMIELKKTQAEKKNEVKKNISLGDECSSASIIQQSSFNGTSPNSSKKSILQPQQQTPNSPTKSTITASNHRMSGDYSQRFKDFLQQQNSPNPMNSLSRHSSVNNNLFNNSSRTLSTDSLDCKEQTSMLGFGNLTPSPFSSIKPIKAAKPTTKFNNLSASNSSPNNLSNNSNNLTNNQTNNQSKDTVSRKEFEELQKKVNDLTDIVETQKQTYKGLMKDIINELADEKKKVANLTIEVDRLRKLTATV